jgi:hypothetical protein
VDQAAPPYEYGSEEELIEEFQLEYSWKYQGTVPAGCRNGRLDPRWKKNGLFGEVGRHPSCILTPGLGRPSEKEPTRKRGSKTIYIEGALDRLHYIVTASEAGLGAEKIRTALEFDVPEYALEVCGNDKSIRCILTRPLVLLLNTANLATLDATDIYNKVWRPYDLPRSRVRNCDDLSRESRSGAYLLAGANPNRADVRDDVSLAIYLGQPGTAEGYVADLRWPGNQNVVDAIRRIAGTDVQSGEGPRRGLDSKDIDLVEKHARKGYDIRIRRCPPAKSVGKVDRDHAVFACGVDVGVGLAVVNPPPMTLLEHSCSHLLFILEKRDKWVRRCGRERWTADEKMERCPVFFAVYDQDRKTCGTSRCKMDFNSPEAVTDED